MLLCKRSSNPNPQDSENPKIQALKIALEQDGTQYEKKKAIKNVIDDFDVINTINNAWYSAKNPESHIQNLVAEYRDDLK